MNNAMPLPHIKKPVLTHAEPDSVIHERVSEGDFIYDASLPGTCDLLVCVTLYNEPPTALNDTLAALSRSHAVLRRHTSPYSDDHAPPSLMICLITDGDEALHPDTRRWLVSSGFTLSDTTNTGHTTHNRLHVQRSALADPPPFGLMPVSSEPEGSCRYSPLLLAEKRDNRGKLDSHNWFFRHLCRVITPRYVLQIDSGSIPDNDCLYHLYLYLEQHHDCAALATHTTTAIPTDASLITNWQYADFIWEKITDWPVSQCLGYMDVLPGQCSLMRYAALIAPGPQGSSPLTRYLRGLHPEGLLEHNQFLAEDRVLGFELIKETPATTTYLPPARLETDACTTLRELMRQRRRWINSTLAARFSALLELPALWREAALSYRRKCQVTLAMLWHCTPLFTLLFSPTLLSLSAALVVPSLLVTDSPGMVQYLWVGSILLLWCGVIVLSRSCSINTATGLRLHQIAMTLMGFTAILLTLSSLLVYPLAIILLFILPLLLIALASPDSPNAGWRIALYYLPSLLFFPLYLTTYSLAQFSDISWGTKGLTHATPNNLSARWKRSRDHLLLGWLMANVILTFTLLSAGEHIYLFFAAVLLSIMLVRYFIAAWCHYFSPGIIHHRYQRAPIQDR